ncbi:MAG TPA: hypothetical protein VGN46_18300 [Luteibacter sp.]|jgi:hypothetical protein|uniref:hypothetical protein n=1 Tax=Luteibacter sp. TaxID=1886636 RepID=UPI002F40A852
MVDLFRYIEHEFAVQVSADPIEIANQSGFQSDLAQIMGRQGPGEGVRATALAYVSEHFPAPTDDPATLGKPLAALPAVLRGLKTVSRATVRDAIRSAFGDKPAGVVASAAFKTDLELLQNATLAVKLVTGFDRVDATRLVEQLRAAALLVAVADPEAAAPTRASVAQMLRRPVRIPPIFLAIASPTSNASSPSPEPDPAQQKLLTLRDQRDRLQAAYVALLSAQPHDFELASAHDGEERRADPKELASRSERLEFVANDIAGPAPVLRLAPAARERLLAGHVEPLERAGVDLVATPMDVAVATVERHLATLNAAVLPHLIATSAKVFRVGGHLFAEPAPTLGQPQQVLEAPIAMPDFSKVVTRPVGIGNLQVVRQELIGYRAADISHIENVLEGELLRHDTERTEESELILTDETVSTQSEERDRQSTDRNELSTETQKETGHQTSAAGDGMSSSDYGRLVENSKSNFAREVVARSVESLTQQVRRQQVQRERRTFVERARHRLDNSKGDKKIRGIYQWVDKIYSMRVLNYGRRLMYDVVVPEPAAFLVQALKNAVQPEAFSLVKPLEPAIGPSQLSSGNYMWYAAQYGVTSAVSPPPQVYARTVAQAEAVRSGIEHIKPYGNEWDAYFQTAFKLSVPEGYRAVRGYVQHVNIEYFGERPGASIEALVGESARLRTDSAENPFLRASFTMAGETGEIPVTLRTFSQIVSLSYAVAIVCQRTDSAIEQWQLKTHATIVSGYQRQLADYEDRLARYVSAVRAQMAMAGNYLHDPAVTRDELKRAFIFLLIGEQPAAWLSTPTPAPLPPGVVLPDPVKVKKWGAMVAFFERAFEWENLMFTCYPYYWGRPQRWEEMLLAQDADPQFEAFLKAGAARVVVPARPGFEAALAHFQETGDVWMGEEIPDMFGDLYVSIIEEIKAANAVPGEEVCVEQWEASLPTTLVLLKDDDALPSWAPTPCNPQT